MVTRARKATIAYDRYLKNNSSEKCEFCGMKKGDKQFIGETKSFKIINNLFPYSLWDQQAVTDHLMIVPKKHTDSLSSLSADEALEYVKLLGTYESQGYNVYARAPSSIIKSVVHQHTHLIKTHTRRKRFIFFIHRPYIRMTR